MLYKQYNDIQIVELETREDSSEAVIRIFSAEFACVAMNDAYNAWHETVELYENELLCGSIPRTRGVRMEALTGTVI